MTRLLLLAALILHAAPVLAQSRVDAALGIGYARTLDDEGSIGSGVSLAGDLSVRVTPRIGLGVRVDRIHNVRDAAGGALVIDGDSTIVGAEARFHVGGGAVQPILHAGYGILSYSGTTTLGAPQTASLFDPSRSPITVTTSTKSGSAGVVSAGADLDVFVSPRISIRPGIMVNMTQGAGESLPWMLWRAGVGVGIHW